MTYPQGVNDAQGSTYNCNVMTCLAPWTERMRITVVIDGVRVEREVGACALCRNTLWLAGSDDRQLALTPGGTVYAPDVIAPGLRHV